MIELKEYRIEYAAAFAAARNNPSIFANGFDKTPNPFTEVHANELIARQTGKTPAQRFFIFWNGEFCGEIGISIGEDIFRLNAEIGYFVAEPFWGKGIATEAIRLMTEYTFKNFEVIRITAGVFAHNKASVRALEKNDYYLESIQKNGVIKNGEIIDDYIFVKLREEAL